MGVVLQGSVGCAAAKGAIEKQEPLPIGDVARRSLQIAANATGKLGWISFWTQLALSIVSAIILLFSVAFTSQVSLCRGISNSIKEKATCWRRAGTGM